MAVNEIEYGDLLTRNGIWNVRQNKPTLIARDLEGYGVPRDITYAVLLGRGVFKWLAVRRDLIKLKDVWCKRLTTAYLEQQQENTAWRKGYIAAYEEARREVRALCHSERFRSPDFDDGAAAYLTSLGKEADL